MWLIAGLGNPGRDYAGTRHNLGFEVVDLLARRWSIGVDRSQFEGLTGKGVAGAEQVVLLKPMTFMNSSGCSVAAAAGFYKIPPDRLIVVLDDLALPPGRIRLRTGGSAGGHNGLDDIIVRLGTDQVPRVRVGIGSPPPGWIGRDWVLARPPADQRESLDEAVKQAADAAALWIEQGAGAAMNRYNQAPGG
ncbi:MAG: Peptidyl-tRNA hydrolase [Phycisphaerae bacterium]|nr:Peptidyl-tRNA hydrolase [Phycisphaerae bacterium]